MTIKITRSVAKHKNLKRYFTGSPCLHGHLAHRFTSNGKCVVCSSDDYKDYYKRNKVFLIARTMKTNLRNRRKLRLELLAAYGNKCQCKGCGIKHQHVLTLEHKGGGGKKHRDDLSTSGVMRDLKNRGWPKDKYTVLCANCNHARGVYGYCPHERGEVL